MILVVSALIGPTESPPPLGPQESGTRYICYTDREVPGWECRLPLHGNPRRAARYAKTHLHELHAEVTIWVDASFDLVARPSDIVAAADATGCKVSAFAHPDRNCMSTEADEIIRLNMADHAAVNDQRNAYHRAGFDTVDNPQKSLTTTGLIVCRHTPQVVAFSRQWWIEIATHTLRDQLSVDFAAWKTGIKIGRLPGHYRDNPFATYNRHRHRQGRIEA